MLNRFKQHFQTSELEDGVDLTTKKIMVLHMNLTHQLQTVEEALLHAIDRNRKPLAIQFIHTLRKGEKIRYTEVVDYLKG